MIVRMTIIILIIIISTSSSDFTQFTSNGGTNAPGTNNQDGIRIFFLFVRFFVRFLDLDLVAARGPTMATATAWTGTITVWVTMNVVVVVVVVVGKKATGTIFQIQPIATIVDTLDTVLSRWK